jgi:hypothetical protein
MTLWLIQAVLFGIIIGILIQFARESSKHRRDSK